ncbi:MAG TPA: ornithine carbamoyltransferase [bacterium]|nr:ornithine carbamoyltransferase [bacterium]
MVNKTSKKNKHLISITDLTVEEIEKIFALAVELKRSPADYRARLAGKMFGLIFEKPSTRTWVSFETGIFQLGGDAIYLGPEDMKLGVREEVRDVARVLDRYLSGVILRTFAHQTVLEFEKYFSKPVINGLSDFEHPCQALADYLTIREKIAHSEKPLVAYVGDGNNVLNSLLLLAAKLGGYFNYATPKKFEPQKKVLEQAMKIAKLSGAVIRGTNDPVEAVADADAVYTDAWVSMGEEEIRNEKLKEFEGMQINEKLMKKARKGALVMHCLPAHRGEEITEEMFEGKSSVVFDQAENRLHVQKAILLHLCS